MKPSAASLAALLAIGMANIDGRRSPPDLNPYPTRMRSRQYRFPQPKNTDNSPDRAKGMKPFDVDGVTIYAGTLKAARKKAALLQHQQTA